MLYLPSMRVSISSLFDKYFGSISGSSKGLSLRSLNSPLLLGCSKTGAIVTVFLYKRGAKYLL